MTQNFDNVPVYTGTRPAANTPATAAKAQADKLFQLVAGQEQQFKKALGNLLPVERFVRVCQTAVRQTPHLGECEPASFMASLMQCAQLGLEPNTPQGLAYLVPFRNGKAGGRYECQLQIGYKGLLELMWRSGMVASINADVVYRQEVEQGLFAYESGMEVSLHHKIDLLHDARSDNDNDIVAAYACAKLKTGQTVVRVLTRKEINQARASSQGGNSPYSPWAKHFKAMALKTAIKRLASWVPTSQAAEAVALEEGYAKIEDGQIVPAQVEVMEEAQSAIEAAAPAAETTAKKRTRKKAEEAPAQAPEVVTAEPVEEPAPAPAPQAVPVKPAEDMDLPELVAHFHKMCVDAKLPGAGMVVCYQKQVGDVSPEEAKADMAQDPAIFQKVAEAYRANPAAYEPKDW